MSTASLQQQFFCLLLVSFFTPLALGVDWPTECGVDNISKNNNNNNKIVGGYFAELSQFPWQAHLVWQGDFFCGGTLIHKDWILTAGHCVFGYEDPVTDYLVILGELNSDVDDGPSEQYFNVTQIFTHPMYRARPVPDYDVALMRLSHSAQFTKFVSPACFVSSDELFPAGLECVTSGWGSVNPEGTIWGPELKYEYMELWENTECNDPATSYIGTVTDRMVCAGFHLTGSDDPQSCAVLGYGDSGGPLVCPSRVNGGNWTVIGATSWENFCAQNKFTPGVFARVQVLRDWIIETMDANAEL